MALGSISSRRECCCPCLDVCVECGGRSRLHEEGPSEEGVSECPGAEEEGFKEQNGKIGIRISVSSSSRFRNICSSSWSPLPSCSYRRRGHMGKLRGFGVRGLTGRRNGQGKCSCLLDFVSNVAVTGAFSISKQDVSSYVGTETDIYDKYGS